MADMRVLQPQAGLWILPVLNFAGFAGSPRPDLVIMTFGAKDERPGETGELSLSVPVTKSDARTLIDGLTALLGQDDLPAAPTGETH